MAGANGSVLEKLRADVPGYRGYEDPAVRHDTDRAFRMMIAECLTRQVQYLGRLTSTFRPKAQGNMLAFVEQLDRLRSNFEVALDVVRNAPEQCGPFFGAPRLAAGRLDGVQRLDAEIYALLDDLDQRARRLLMPPNMFKECVNVSNMVIELERLSGARDAAMAGIR